MNAYNSVPIPSNAFNKVIDTRFTSVLYFFVFVKRHPRRPASLRHVTKNPSPQLLYFPHLQNRDARNSFTFCSYVNWRQLPALFSLSPVSHSPVTPSDFIICT